jgi:hypothetical protein
MMQTSRNIANKEQLGYLGDELLVKIFREVEPSNESNKVLLKAIAKVLASRKMLHKLSIKK